MTDLVPEWRVGAVSLTEAPFAVPFGGVDYGAPENVTELIRSMFLDGDYEVSSKSGNRTVVLPVLIADTDMAALADAEALLAVECDKVRNEVYVDPGDTYGEPFIFDVFRGELVFSRDDVYEQHGYRSYTLTFRALPTSRSVTEVELTPTPTSIGTARQQMHTVTVEGSARSEAAITVGHASTALDQALIYSFPDDGSGYEPPLRQYASTATASAATADAATVSGARNMLDTPAHFDIPGDKIMPGRHILIGKARTSAPGSATMDVTVGSYIGNPSGGTAKAEVSWEAGINTAADAGSPTTYRMVLLTSTTFMAPQVAVGDPAASTVRVTVVDADTSGIDIDLDEVWLLNLTTGALTWVASAEQRVFIEPPSAAIPTGRVLTGDEADKSDAFGPGGNLQSWGRHVLPVGDVKILTVTTGPTGAVTTVRYPKRWHTHAGS